MNTKLAWKRTSSAPDLDSFLVNAVREASKSLMNQRGALSTIRNGGWEHAFRNRILEVTERFQSLIGFSEASEKGVNRIDIAYRCKKCGGCVLVAEVKSNFITQACHIRGRRLDACLQLEPLARIGLPAYLVYVVLKQTWYEKQSRLVSIHNESLARSCSYKKFTKAGLKDLPRADMFARILPVTTEERRFAADCVRVSIRVWLARCAPRKRAGGMSLTFINGKAESGAQRAVLAKELTARRKQRKRRKSIPSA